MTLDEPVALSESLKASLKAVICVIHIASGLHVKCSIAAVSPPAVSMTRPTGNSHLKDLIRLLRPECEKLTGSCANIRPFDSNMHTFIAGDLRLSGDHRVIQ